MYYVYILKSKFEDQIYVGSTNDLKNRLRDHNDGKVFSTKHYKPWDLIYYEAYAIEELARMREKRLKQHGNAIRELKKRLGLSSTVKNKLGLSGAIRNKLGLPSTILDGAGFTIIELILTMAITIGIGTFASNFYSNFLTQNSVSNTQDQFLGSLRKAQIYAMAGKRGSSWGVHYDSGTKKITLYSGSAWLG